MSKKVEKFKKKSNINLGTLIFAFLIIYLGVGLIYTIKKNKIDIYEVQVESLSGNVTLTGVIVRDEKVVTSAEPGYINYYVQDKKRIHKNETVYSIDANKTVFEALDSQNTVSLTSTDREEIKRAISTFQDSYSNISYDNVYDLKEKLTFRIRSLSDRNILADIQEYSSQAGNNSAFRFVKSDQSGLISYRGDKLDGLSVETVSLSTFQTEDFTAKDYRSTAYYETGTPVYKIIDSDSWDIVCLISAEQYTHYFEKQKLKFTVEEDGFTFTAPIEFVARGSEYYMVIHMSKYILKYLDMRFLTLDIAVTDIVGLKVPKTALINKNFYLVPLEYLTVGGDSNEVGVYSIMYNSQTGEPDYVFTTTDISYQTEEYAYVSKDSLVAGTQIYNEQTMETMTVAMEGTLKGVYNVNRGYAVFRRVEIIAENDDYVIIERGISNSLSAYDHISLNAEFTEEASIIYK